MTRNPNTIANVARSAMMTFAIGALSMSLLSAIHASAQAQPQSSCPAGYTQIDTVWSNAKGDVASATSQTVQIVAAKHGGRTQDWKIGALCVHMVSGDVEIFEPTAHDQSIALSGK